MSFLLKFLSLSKIDILADSFLARSIQKTEQSYTLAKARLPAYQYYEARVRNCLSSREKIVSLQVIST